jgi:hypothetical protein
MLAIGLTAVLVVATLWLVIVVLAALDGAFV